MTGKEVKCSLKLRQDSFGRSVAWSDGSAATVWTALFVARRRRNAYLCAVDFQVSHLLQPFQGRCASSRQRAVSGADLRQRLQALPKLRFTLLFQGSQQTLLRQMRRENQAEEGSRTQAPSA